MSRPIKPLRDLYFRYLKGTDCADRLESTEVACLLHRQGLIDLFADPEGTGLTHYRDTGLMQGMGLTDVRTLLKEYVSTRDAKRELEDRYGK